MLLKQQNNYNDLTHFLLQVIASSLKAQRCNLSTHDAYKKDTYLEEEKRSKITRKLKILKSKTAAQW